MNHIIFSYCNSMHLLMCGRHNFTKMIPTNNTVNIKLHSAFEIVF